MIVRSMGSMWPPLRIAYTSKRSDFPPCYQYGAILSRLVHCALPQKAVLEELSSGRALFGFTGPSNSAEMQQHSELPEQQG